ncbi:glycosyltransferase [candidate division KSB1 bacterium]|nr:glycosyltransferase [candidate division KSB1 bacterium]
MSEQQPKVKHGKNFLFSFIIPTFNRPFALNRALQSIAEQKEQEEKIELIVVNDGGTDIYNDIITKYTDQILIIYRYQKNQRPARARNNGARLSHGKYLVFLDDDCSLSSDWVKFAKNRIRPDRLIGGKTVNCIPENIYAQASQDLIDYLYTYYNREYQNSEFITSNNMIIPKAMFKALNGFDTDFTDAAAEDRDFCDRVKYAGYEIYYAPDIIICHWHQMNFIHFFTQHFKYGFRAKLFHEKRSLRNDTQFKVEPPSFYVHLIFFPLKTIPFCWP